MSNNFLDFFGFEEDPFKITPDIDFFFNSKSHQNALTALEYIYHSEEGFVVIVGEPGTGKTITIRKFLSKIPENMEYAYILFPNLSPEELLYAILEDFGIKIPNQNITKNKLFSMLKDFLIEKKKEGKKIFIIVDEAQNLSIETLEELRILSNLETEKEKLLQIVLVGQPELEEKLNSPRLRQLKQRITVFIRLNNLSKDEVENYINYRLSKAGNIPIRITKKAINEIYKLSKGIPRVINQIMERALMSAFVNQETTIDKKHIKQAKQSLNIENSVKGVNIFQLTLPKIIFIFILGGIFFLINYFLFIKTSDNIQSKKTYISTGINQNMINTKATNKTNQKQTEDSKDKNNATKEEKYYILYFATTPSFEEAKKIKEEYESISGKKFNILKVQNGKYYSVARLYKDKETGKKDLERLKKILKDNDAFLTGKMFSVEIVK